MIQDNELTHTGVLGMRWGVRRSPKAGSSAHKSSDSKITTLKKQEKPKKVNVKDLSDQELTDIIRRMDNEKRYNDFMKAQIKTTGSAKAKEFVTSVLEKSGKEVASKVVTYALGKAINKMMHDTVISVGKDIPKKKDD